MILLIDIGSSRLKWGLLKNDAFSFGGAFSYAQNRIDELLEAAWATLTDITQILIASVADKKVNEAVAGWIAQAGWPTPSFIQSPSTGLGLTNAYHEPEQLGVDRWLGMAAGWHKAQGKPVCIISCGTFVTVDVVDASGQHLGGLIIPGLKLMQSSLKTYGKQYSAPSLSVKDYPTLLAKDTYHAVTGGGVYALIAFIESITTDMAQALGRQMVCILTGGDAPEVQPLLKTPCQCEPYLVLQGLALWTMVEEEKAQNLPPKKQRKNSRLLTA